MLGNEETLQKIPKEKVCKILTLSECHMYSCLLTHILTAQAGYLFSSFWTNGSEMIQII